VACLNRGSVCVCVCVQRSFSSSANASILSSFGSVKIPKLKIGAVSVRRGPLCRWVRCVVNRACWLQKRVDI
jgi:hypothetical protein